MRTSPEETRTGDVLTAGILGFVGASCGLFPIFRVLWFPEDYGLLALQARNVLQGKVVHRDFIEVYTGLLTYLNAALFLLFGSTFDSLQIGMMACTFLFCVASFLLLRRFCSIIGSAVLTLVLLCMGPLQFYAPLPSWFNLTLTLFAVLGVFKYRESGRCRYALAAGAAIGASAAIKITGLVVVPAILLMLGRGKEPADRWSVRAEWGLAACLGTVLVSGGLLVRFGSAAAWGCIAGPLGLCLLLLAQRLRRMQRLDMRAPSAFTAGLLLVVGPLLVGLWAAGGLEAFLVRTFAENLSRFQFAAAAPQTTWEDLWLAVFCVAMLSSGGSDRRRRAIWISIAIAALLLDSVRSDGGYPLYWLLLGMVAHRCLETMNGLEDDEDQYKADLLLFTTALFGLLLIPFARAIYLHYQMPLVLVSLVAQAAAGTRGAARTFSVPMIIVVSLLLLPRGDTPLGLLISRGFDRERYTPLAETGAGSMLFKRAQAESIDSVSRVLAGAIGSSDAVYCGPDLPHLTFLLPYRDVGTAAYGFMEPPGFDERLRAAILEGEISAVVRPKVPAFSPQKLDPEFLRGAFARDEAFETLEVSWEPRRNSFNLGRSNAPD